MTPIARTRRPAVMADEDLLACVGSGEADAFEVIHDRHSRPGPPPRRARC
jgi:hypothetical protein